MRHAALAAVLCLFAACSSGYDSALLGVKYAPPRGLAFVDEQPGPPAVAHFSGGLELFSVQGEPPEIDESRLDQLLPKLVSAAKLTPPRDVVSAKAGSIPLGPVARFAMKDGDTRTLLYYVPLSGRFLLVKLTAGEGRYGELEAQVERSLSTLKLR